MTCVTDQLPQGWRWVLPGDLASRQTHSLGIGPFGSDLKVSDYTESGVPLVFVRNIRSGSFALANQPHVSKEKAAALFAHRVLPGDLLITKMGEPPGDAFVYPANACEARMTADCIRLRVAHEVATPTFLMYATRSSVVRQQIISATKGVAQKKISLDRYRSVRYPLPPLAEQHRIVATLDTQATRMDAAVALLERVKANLKRARASVLKTAVEGRLVPTEAALARKERRDYEPGSALLARMLTEHRARWTESGGKGKYASPAKFVPGALHELPEGWVWTNLDNLLHQIEAGRSFAADNTPPQGTQVGIVKVSAVTWGRYQEKESKTVHDQRQINSGYFIHPGDFLFSRANTIDLVGAAVIVDNTTRDIMLSDKILRLHLPENIKRWVLWVLRSQLGRKQIESLSTGNQESMRNIGQERIKQIAIPLPPATEQRRIVAEVDRRFSVLDAIERTVEADLARCMTLRQAVLKCAFEGRLVPPEHSAAFHSVLGKPTYER